MKNLVSRTMVIFLVLAFIFSFAACSGNNSTTGQSTEKTVQTSTAATVEKSETTEKKANVSIRVAVLDNPGERENAEFVKRAFNEKYPYITIVTETLQADPKKIITQAAAGELADVTWLPMQWLVELVEGGVLASVDQYMDVVGVNKSDIYPSMLAAGQRDGKTYMVPRDYNHVSTFVNTTILKNEGIDMPKDDWTWEQCVDIIKKVTKKDASGKTTQFGLAADTAWPPVYESFMMMFGGNAVDYTGKKTNFADPLVIKGIKEILDLEKGGYALNQSQQYPQDMFNAGKVAFLFMVKPRCVDINASAKSGGWDWDVIEFPKMPTAKVVGSGASGYGVYAKSKHLDEAGMFAAYFATTEGQKAFSQSGNCVPVVQSLKEDRVWKDNPVAGKNQGAFVANPQLDAEPLLDLKVPIPVLTEAQSGINDAFNKYLLGKALLEDALKSLDDKVNAVWAKN